jgi:hypothetical protein
MQGLSRHVMQLVAERDQAVKRQEEMQTEIKELKENRAPMPVSVSASVVAPMDFAHATAPVSGGSEIALPVAGGRAVLRCAQISVLAAGDAGSATPQSAMRQTETLIGKLMPEQSSTVVGGVGPTAHHV